MLVKPPYRSVGGGVSLWFAVAVDEDLLQRCLEEEILV
jgi:hypothetical protein